MTAALGWYVNNIFLAWFPSVFGTIFYTVYLPLPTVTKTLFTPNLRVWHANKRARLPLHGARVLMVHSIIPQKSDFKFTANYGIRNVPLKLLFQVGKSEELPRQPGAPNLIWHIPYLLSVEGGKFISPIHRRWIALLTIYVYILLFWFPNPTQMWHFSCKVNGTRHGTVIISGAYDSTLRYTILVPLIVTHSLSSSFKSWNAPLSMVVILFSISCLRGNTKRGWQ